MCLILFAYRVHADAPLVVAANRDEFYARPTAAARFWTDAPTILAGRDLQAGGTWLGVDRRGRFAAVTNYREEPPATAPPGSRGELTAAFLEGDAAAADYARAIDPDRYRGFSLLLFDGTSLVCASNRAPLEVVEPGVHGLANVDLDCDWPKVRRGCAGLATLVDGDALPATGALIDLLADRTMPPDEHLPQFGREIEFERRAAPVFIESDNYGTRASTALVMTHGDIRFSEQNFTAQGAPTERFDVEFAIDQAAPGPS
jgi:uncharacterized protein with NRDE domain